MDFAAIFRRIARLLEIKGEEGFKTGAYERAAESMEMLTERLDTLSEQELVALPGIGKAIAAKVIELAQSGKLVFLEKLEEEVPPSLLKLLEITDVGPRKVSLFWKQLNIHTLDELEKAAREGKLRALPGIGEKSEARILTGIEVLKAKASQPGS